MSSEEKLFLFLFSIFFFFSLQLQKVTRKKQLLDQKLSSVVSAKGEAGQIIERERERKSPRGRDGDRAGH